MYYQIVLDSLKLAHLLREAVSSYSSSILRYLDRKIILASG
jgi:hypothetical protein